MWREESRLQLGSEFLVPQFLVVVVVVVIPARQLWVLEPENSPPNLRVSQGKRLWYCWSFQDYRFAFSAKYWQYC